MRSYLRFWVLALTPIGLFAQMAGGLAGFGMMNQAMNGMGGSGPVVGPDGTAFALRTRTINTGMMGYSSSRVIELIAVNPTDGTTRWTLELNGYMFSGPALAPDGTIFVTDSEPGTMFDWSNGIWGPGTRGDSAQKSRLFVITTTATSATIAAQVEIDVDMLSQPVIASDGAGAYLVYVATFDMGQPGAMMGNGATGVDRKLCAFLPDGTLKFSLALGQTPMGLN